MKRCVSVACAGLILLCGSQMLAENPYLYQMYEEYYRGEVSPPPPPPGNGLPEVPVPSPQQQKTRTGVPGPPEFLFPKELGFGVAAGVPFDMMYLSGAFYLVQGGTWYRSPSYRGPWAVVPRRDLPPVLVEHDLASIRELRNREFRELWEKGNKYRGRRFRPAEKPPGKQQGKGQGKEPRLKGPN